jgi:aryl-alcohol dehydrogenase
MEIKAAVLKVPKSEFEIEKVELDQPNSNEVLVKIVATGLCHTDIAVRDQDVPFFDFPAILGHEGAGIVETVGSKVTKVKPGDHVVLAPASCGICEFCQSGHPSYCIQFFQLNISGKRLDGSYPYHQNDHPVNGLFFYQSSFATYALASERNVVKVADDVPLEMLGPLGCGLQTGAGSVLNVLRPHAGESIAVYGVGPVGLAAIMAAKIVGCTTIIAVDINDLRLGLAKELGATHSVNSRGVNSAEIIKQQIIPEGINYAFDTTGRNDVINQAITSLKNMGKCVLVGVSSAPRLELDNSVFTMGKSVRFVTEGDSVPDIFIPQLIDLYKKDLFPFDKLIKFYAMDQINQAAEDSEKGTTLKAVIRFA